MDQLIRCWASDAIEVYSLIGRNVIAQLQICIEKDSRDTSCVRKQATNLVCVRPVALLHSLPSPPIQPKCDRLARSDCRREFRVRVPPPRHRRTSLDTPKAAV